MPAASGPVPTRRAVLRTVGGAAVVATGWSLTGCDSSPAARPSASKSQHSADPVTQAQRRAAIADEQELISAYQETSRTHPNLNAILAIPLAHHEAHLKALGAPATSSASPTAPPSAAAWTPPADPLLAVRSLAAKEQVVARRRRTACAIATGEWAGLLGSLGACEAGHATLLGTT